MEYNKLQFKLPPHRLPQFKVGDTVYHASKHLDETGYHRLLLILYIYICICLHMYRYIADIYI